MMPVERIVYHFFNEEEEMPEDILNIVNSIKIFHETFKIKKDTKQFYKIKNINVCDISILIKRVGFIIFKQGIEIESVVELFYFCNKLATLCQKQKCSNYIPVIVECLTQYIIKHLQEWIEINDGWNKLVSIAKCHQYKNNMSIFSCFVQLCF